MVQNRVREYFLADVYAIDCNYKDSLDVLDNIEERIKKIGSFMVCPVRNNVFIEVSTGKRIGSIDRTKLKYENWQDGFDYPNLFVDINSLKKVSKEELVNYKKEQNSVKNEMFFIRETILNGNIPFGKKFYKTSLKYLNDDYEEEFYKPISERDLDKHSEDFGSYIFTNIGGQPYVEVLTCKPFSFFYSKVSHKQDGTPWIKLVRDICAKEHTNLLADSDNKKLLMGNDVSKEFQLYCLLDSNKLDKFFISKEQELIDRNKMDKTKVLNPKKDNKE